MANLIPVEHQNQRVMTTKLLAQQFGTEENNIKVNFNRNIERFIEGKHFYKLEGAELADFKNLVTESNLVDKRTPSLILWTERGAARHAKILDTDEAWEIYEMLEETYFRVKETPVINTPITADTWINQLNAVNTTANNFIAAGMTPGMAVEFLRDTYNAAGITIPRFAYTNFYFAQEIAAQIGLRGKKDTFTKNAIEQIISECDIEKHEVRNTYDPKEEIIVKKYSESVIYKVEKWLAEHDYPGIIPSQKDGKSYLYEVGYIEKKIPTSESVSTNKLIAAQSPEKTPTVLKVDDIKDILGIGRVQAYQLARREDFPVIRVGKRMLIPRDLFFAWLNSSIKGGRS